jgi:hypothetical protein
MRIFFLVLVFCLVGVQGIEGVNPVGYSVDFEENLSKDFEFTFFLDNGENLNLDGVFAQYVELDEDKVWDEGKVVASLVFPAGDFSSLGLSYGFNDVWVEAGEVKGLIRVNVPYPDDFVLVDVKVPNVNVGEEVDFTLSVENMGLESILLNSSVEIYAEEGEVLFEVFEWENVSVESGELVNLRNKFDSSNYSGGEYFAVAKVVVSDDVVLARDSFRLGVFDVKILNYTTSIASGDIQKFKVTVESLWDDDMPEVYFEARPVVEGAFPSFDSSIVSLDAWEVKTLVGYLDARELEGEFEIDINIRYDDEESLEKGKVLISKEAGMAVYFLSLIALVFVIWFLFFRRKSLKSS